MNELEESILGCCGAFGIFFATILFDTVLLLIHASILQLIWGIFILPFITVSELPFFVALGICLGMTLLKIRLSKNMHEEAKEKDFFTLVINHVGTRSFATIIFVLLIWLVSFLRPEIPSPDNRINLFEAQDISTEEVQNVTETQPGEWICVRLKLLFLS